MILSDTVSPWGFLAALGFSGARCYPSPFSFPSKRGSMKRRDFLSGLAVNSPPLGARGVTTGSAPPHAPGEAAASHAPPKNTHSWARPASKRRGDHHTPSL